MSNWYSEDIEEVFLKLQTTESGLSETEAELRLKKNGPNVVLLSDSENSFQILLRQIHNPIVYLLLVSTLFAFLLGKVSDSFVVLSVVVINTLIGFIQEFKANSAIKNLNALVPYKTTVIRDSQKKVIHSKDVVIGDVIYLEPGDRVAADIRLFHVRNLKCDESILTGESSPTFKRVEKESKDSLIADQKCMAFTATFVTSGIGLGVVCETGLNTQFGKISELVESVKSVPTPMMVFVKKLGVNISIFTVCLSVLMFLIGLARGNLLFDAAFLAITLAVALIPEGLPAIIQIAYSVGVRRMAKKQAIIRKLPAVEALGSTTVICTDKTGTLTYNEMTVQKISTKSGFTFVSGSGYFLKGSFESQNKINGAEIDEIIKAATVCNDAFLNEHEKAIIPVGDPTEIAIVVLARKRNIFEKALREEWKRKDVIPFDSTTRKMATLNHSSGQGSFIFVKGAPEEVMRICLGVDHDALESSLLQMAKDGMRILAVAKKQVDVKLTKLHEDLITEGFEFLGFLAMIDPPRKEVYEALKTCKEAGIKVKMITGDHPITAEAIAKDLKILTKGSVVDPSTLKNLDKEGWKKIVTHAEVFARVEPEHKLFIVEALQSLGNVVAMTGDGVNDAAALKKADIGVSMGIKGTEVAKEASSMVLADDNFVSIAEAVREGRRVYDNLIKAIVFTLPTSLGQALVIIIAVLFFPVGSEGLLHPILPIHILWINLVVAVGLSLPLAFETEEENIMKRAPRKKNSSILNPFLIVRTLTIASLMALITIVLFHFEFAKEIGVGKSRLASLTEAQTTAVTAIMLFQVVYLFNCRTLKGSKVMKGFFSNKVLFLSVALVLFLQLAFVYLPFMNQIFRSTPLDLESWVISSLASVTVIVLLRVEDWIGRILQIFKR